MANSHLSHTDDDDVGTAYATNSVDVDIGVNRHRPSPPFVATRSRRTLYTRIYRIVYKSRFYEMWNSN